MEATRRQSSQSYPVSSHQCTHNLGELNASRSAWERVVHIYHFRFDYWRRNPHRNQRTHINIELDRESSSSCIWVEEKVVGSGY